MRRDTIKKFAGMSSIVQGIGINRSADWPSRRLHDIPKSLNADGVDPRRLSALGDFIAELPPWPRDGGAGIGLSRVDGRTEVTHIVVRPHGPDGLGFLRFKSPDSSEIVAYVLTGYGLCCWGWGLNWGLASVCTNGRVDDVQRVLTAGPVLDDHTIPSQGRTIEPRHVAAALYAYVETLDPVEAWRRVMLDLDGTRLVVGKASERTHAIEIVDPERPAPEPEPELSKPRLPLSASDAARHRLVSAYIDVEEHKKDRLYALLDEGVTVDEAYALASYRDTSKPRLPLSAADTARVRLMGAYTDVEEAKEAMLRALLDEGKSVEEAYSTVQEVSCRSRW